MKVYSVGGNLVAVTDHEIEATSWEQSAEIPEDCLTLALIRGENGSFCETTIFVKDDKVGNCGGCGNSCFAVGEFLNKNSVTFRQFAANGDYLGDVGFNKNRIYAKRSTFKRNSDGSIRFLGNTYYVGKYSPDVFSMNSTALNIVITSDIGGVVSAEPHEDFDKITPACGSGALVLSYLGYRKVEYKEASYILGNDENTVWADFLGSVDQLH